MDSELDEDGASGVSAVERALLSLVPGRVRARYGLKVGLALLAVVVVVAASGGAIYASTSAQLTADSERELVTTARLQSETLDAWVRTTKRETRTLSDTAALRSGDPERVDAYLDATVADAAESVGGGDDHSGGADDDSGHDGGHAGDHHATGVTAVSYVDLDSGRVLASSNDSLEDTDLAAFDAAWARDPPALSDPSSVTVTRPFVRPQSGEPTIAFLSRVADRDRAVVVFASLHERAETFHQPVRGGWTVVVDDRGVLVVSQHHEEMLTQHSGGPGVDSAGTRRALAGEAGFTTMGMDSGTVLMGYAPVAAADWALMVHAPASAAYALRSAVTGQILGMLGVTVLAVALLGVTVGRNTVTAVTRLTDRARRLEAGDLDVPVASAREDEIGELYAAFDGMRDSLREQIAAAERARSEAERRRTESAALAEHLEATADEYGAVMAAAAAGDLSRTVRPDDRSEAMAAVARSFNDMTADLSATVTSVQTFAEDVAAASEQVTASAAAIQQSSAGVSEAVQEISDGAARQSERLQAVVDEMQTLSATVEEMASASDQAAERARRAVEAGEGGRDHAEAALSDMDRIEATAEAAAGEVDALAAEVERIDEVVALIDDVAEQTNVLALNAAVEASRAGDHGEGFAVVADEVKALAEQTREATSEVRERIETVQSRTETTVDEIHGTRETVAEGQATIEAAVDSLTTVVEHVEDADAGVRSIEAATDEAAATAVEVVSAVEEVAAISEETTAQAESVAAAAEEQAAETTEVSESAEQLAEQATHLRRILEQFDVRADDAGRSAVTDAVVGRPSEDD